MKRYWKQTAAILLSLFVLIAVGLGAWVFKLNGEIKDKLQTRRFLPPTEFYTAPASFYRSDAWNSDQVRQFLLSRNYGESPLGRPLNPGQFWVLQTEDCIKSLPETPETPPSSCVILSHKKPWTRSSPLIRTKNCRHWCGVPIPS